MSDEKIYLATKDDLTAAEKRITVLENGVGVGDSYTRIISSYISPSCLYVDEANERFIVGGSATSYIISDGVTALSSSDVKKADSSVSTNSVETICYLKHLDRWVMAENNNYYYYSDDIENNVWTKVDHGETGHIKTAYSEKLQRMVAVFSTSSKKCIKWSDDGATLNDCTLSSSVSFTDVCWCDWLDCFFAYGKNGTTAVSSDGINWTIRTGGTTLYKDYIVCTDNYAWTFSDNGLYYTSDLVNWVSFPVTTSGLLTKNIRNICYSGGYVIICNVDASIVLLNDNDLKSVINFDISGTGWTYADMAGINGNTLFLVNNNDYNRIYRVDFAESSVMRLLKKHIGDAKAEMSDIKKSVSDGKTLVANAITAKGVSTATNATFQTMADNVSSIITLDSVPHTTADGTVYDNAYINTNEVKYVIDFTNLNNAVYTNSSSVKMSHACYGDGNIVFIAQTGDIFYSSNGSDWNTSTVDTGNTSKYKSIVYGNGKYVVLEYDSSKVYVSTDLINWEAVSTGVTYSGGDIAFGDGRFVVSSNGSSASKQFAYSDDAVNWVTTDYISSNIKFSLVEYCGNNTFLAASRVNTAYYVYLSTDGGVTWTGSTKLPTSSSTRIYSVAYGNGIYVMKGASSILTSTDGLNWSLSSTSISAEILYFDEDIKMFICVGDRVIGYSKDAITWNTFNEYLIPYYDLNQNKLAKSVGVAIKFGNKIFIASDESWTHISSINHEYMVLCKIPNNTYLDGVDYVKYVP